MREWDFPAIAAGDTAAEASWDVLKWSLGDEFPSGYRFSIGYGPDIRQDGNQSNDDCSLSNNSTEISGEEINAIIRGSGI